MPQPVPDPITSTPSVPGQPYDATADGSVGRWEKTTSGPTNDRFRVSGGDFPDSAPWQQC